MKASVVSIAAAVSRRSTDRPALLRCVLYLTLATTMISPLLWVTVPALVDYPVHLARMWILAQHGNDPDLASNYLIHWRLVPNLAMDLVVPIFAQLMAIDTAGRLFVALIMLGIFGGTLALHRALHGELGIWPACSLLFIYNAALFWGFLNFLFGLAIFLLAFSGWIATRDWKLLPRLSLFSATASLLLILHLFAFGLYGLSVMSYEFGRILEHRRLNRAALVSLCTASLQFVPALLLAAHALSSAPGFTFYGTLQAKQYALLAPWSFTPGVSVFDRVFLFFSITFLIFAIATRSLRLRPEMRWPLAVMVIAAVLMPNWLSGSWAADIRIPVTLPFLIVAGTRLDSPWRRTIGIFAVTAVVLITIRIWSVTEIWRDYDRRFLEFRAATRVMPPGARLLLVQDPELPTDQLAIGNLPTMVAQRSQQMFWHMPALAVIDRAAFIPFNMFTGWTPIDPTPRDAGLFVTQSLPLKPQALLEGADSEILENLPRELLLDPDERPYWLHWPKNFDFVVWVDFGQIHSQPENLQSVEAGSFFHIYRVIRR